MLPVGTIFILLGILMLIKSSAQAFHWTVWGFFLLILGVVCILGGMVT